MRRHRFAVPVVVVAALTATTACHSAVHTAVAAVSSPSHSATERTTGAVAVDAGASGRIVFSDEPVGGGVRQLYLEWADGSHRHHLVRSPYDDVTPTISPDGRSVVFSRERARGDLPDQTYVVGTDGQGLHRVPFGGCPARCGDAVEGRAWSPDGSRLVFTRAVFTAHGSLRGVPPDHVELWVADADGSHARRLTSEHGTAQDDDAAWSPDGSRIAFLHWVYGQTSAEPDHFRIATIPAAGGAMAMVTPQRLDSADPSYSPDGELILFQSPPDPFGTGGDQVLYTVHPDGTGLVALTKGLVGPATNHPSWSPDGKQIVFSHLARLVPGGPGADLWLIGRDGSDPHALAVTPRLNENAPSWGAAPH